MKIKIVPLDARDRVKPGTRVQLSGAFLSATGQAVGGEGARVFVVVECDCKLCEMGRFVAVNEHSITGGQRHIAEANTVRLGTPSVRNIG